MRIWSIHPSYLDAKGLVALWRETLLAKNVLQGKTKGYRNHPQLDRFKQVEMPADAIDRYLMEVFLEADVRGYHFDKAKINWKSSSLQMVVTSEQINFERNHLLRKLKIRDRIRFDTLKKLDQLDPHPLFQVIEGGIEKWEVI